MPFWILHYALVVLHAEGIHKCRDQTIHVLYNSTEHKLYRCIYSGTNIKNIKGHPQVQATLQ